MIKVFISQPMRGKTERDIMKVRNNAFIRLSEIYGECELINSLITEEFDENHIGLKYLSKSIEMLDGADEAWFLDGWRYSRGCRIEYECCISYGIPVYFLEREVDD